MRSVLLAVLVSLVAASAQAQNLACVPTSELTPVVPGVSRLSFQSLDHATNDASGQPLVTEYLAELRQVGQSAILASFPIPKTQLAIVSGATVPSCYQMVLPTSMPGIPNPSPTTTYTLTIAARGPSGVAPGTTTVGPFFLTTAGRGVDRGRIW